jgi:O-antigen/teichoic acid export membrane protein
MILIPKVMTAPVYGLFAVFLSVYMLCESFTGLGNMQVFGRFLPTYAEDDEEGRRRFLHGMLLYGVLITLAIMACVTLVLLLWQPEGFRLSWIIALFLVLLFGKIQGTLFSYLYGMNQIGRFSSRDLIRSFSRFAVVLGLFLAFGLYGAIWAFVVNELVLVAVSAWWVRDALFSRVGIVPWREIRSYMSFGLAFYVPTVLVGMLQRSGGLLIARWSGVPEEVAYFDLANQFLLLTVSFLGILLATLLPSLATFKERGSHKQAEDWLRHAVIFCVAMAVLALYALSFAGPFVIPIIGDTFDVGRVYGNALLLGAAAFPLLLVHVGSNWAVLQKDAIGYGVISALAALAMILLSWAMIPLWGSFGASLASLTAYCIFALLFCLRYWAIMRVMLVGLLRVVACAVVPAALLLIPLPALLQAVMFAPAALLFVLILLATHTVRLSDIRKYISMLRG